MNIREELAPPGGNEPHEASLDDSKMDGRKKKGRKSNMEKKSQSEHNEVEVRKSAFCDLHTPLDILNKSPYNKKNADGLGQSGIFIFVNE